MRRLGALLAIIAMLVGAGLSYLGAIVSVNVIEDSSELGVRQALDSELLDWAEVEADGLRVILTGTAPNEALRFKAMSTAGTVVDSARVVDQLEIAVTAPLKAPRFSIEILRNDSGVSLIGLVPKDTERTVLAARFSVATNGAPIADLLESANFNGPAGWDKAVDFAVKATSMLERSKISVAVDAIDVTAVADSEEEKDAAERELLNLLPAGILVDLNVSAPRPVITPFTLRFLIDGDGARFDACAADDQDAVNLIMRAARDAGLPKSTDCVLGLGVPSPSWGDAASRAIRALGALGKGEVTLSDVDITLIASASTSQTDFDRVVGELENNLPDVFSLHAVLPTVIEAQDMGPPEFTATLSPEGQLQMRGRLPDELSRDAVRSFARAQFISGATHMAARIDPNLPTGWAVRAMTALEALAQLNNGAISVEPDAVTITGRTGNKTARSEITRILSDGLGKGQRFDIDVTYDALLDPATFIPTPEECLADIQSAAAANKITFEPSSAQISAVAQSTIDAIGEILKKCGEIRIEVQGHTDSQGRESMNLTLSQSRAEAVIEELMNRRILVSNITAKGYGETTPIADNDTEEGREANRRIEFRLIQPDATVSETDTDAQSEEGDSNE